ncbi:MAG: HD domain-containing phosphohydrolase, partial [Syntrophales bacterium]
MRKSLGDTIQDMAMAVETRGAHTAGHQRRVADLTIVIATEMSLTAGQIDGIRLTAAIHDIGKIIIPVEIFSKLKQLTDVEFRLIKTHDVAGYDILKYIEFPWPIASIILEHHERIDGSG